jgi:RHS repeat-associated protein
VLDGWQEIEELSTDGTRKAFTYGNYIDELISQTINGSVYYGIQNHQYSISALTNATGRTVEKYEYLPYGKWSVFDSLGNEIAASAVGNVVGFTGRWWNGENNIWYFKWRMYSDKTARFLSRDPLRFIDGLNLYCNFFLVKSTDPFGLFVKQCKKNGIGGAKYDGCGPPEYHKLIPEAGIPFLWLFGGFLFTPACYSHDICYQECDRSKKDCDDTFLKELNEICDKWTVPLWWKYDITGIGELRAKVMCKSFAYIYYKAVDWGGGEGWRKAHEERCESCDKKTCEIKPKFPLIRPIIPFNKDIPMFPLHRFF